MRSTPIVCYDYICSFAFSSIFGTRFISVTKSGNSLFNHLSTSIIRSLVSLTLFKFHEIGSWWNTLFLKSLILFNGAETLFLYFLFFSRYGNARLKGFQSIRSYSAFNKRTQKPIVNSATILLPLIVSFLLAICFLALFILVFKLRSPIVELMFRYHSVVPKKGR